MDTEEQKKKKKKKKKTKIETAFAWLFQVTNCRRENLDKAKKGKSKERN